MLKKDNSFLWIYDSGRKIQTQDGREAVISICMDITEQVETENQLHSIVSNDLGGIFKAQMDDDFTILYANEGYFALHGYTRQQWQTELSNHAAPVVHPDDALWVKERLTKALQMKEQKISFEYRIRRRDGSVGWILVSAVFSKTNMGTILAGMIFDITERKTMEQELRCSEQRFEIAISHAGIHVWEYDLKQRRIIQTQDSRKVYEMDKVIENVPESLIDNNMIHPDSAKEYLGLYQAIHNGVKNTSAIVQVRTRDSGYRWEKISYTTIFDPDGTPVRAVAISEDVTAQKLAERRYFQEEQLREMLSIDVMISTKVNLTKNALIRIWSKKNYPPTLDQIVSYENLYHLFSQYIANSEDKKRYLESFHLDALLESYRNREQSICAEYRCINEEGQIIWISFNITMLSDPDTGDVLLFGYVRDIDKRKKIELALRERAERDAITGLYNKPTIESMIQSSIKENRKQNGRCALLVIDLDDFKQVNDHHGHLYGDQLLKEIGRILSAEFQNRSLAGRIGGDEFVVFLENIPNHKWAVKQAEKICRLLSISYLTGGESRKITASVGVSISLQHIAEYEQLFQQADSALYNSKKEGKARYTCYRNQSYYEGKIELSSNECVAKQHLGATCMLDELDQMIFVIDYNTHNMLFMNSPAKKAFGIDNSEYLGSKCYELLQGFSQPCIFCQNHLPEEQGFKVWENMNAKLHKNFSIQDKIIQWDGRPARLELYHEITSSQPQGSSIQTSERLLLEAVGFLFSADTLQAAITGVLERLGNFYVADRCYFVQINDNMDRLSVSYEWLASGITSTSKTDASYDGTAWLSYLCRQHVVACHDVDKLRLIFPQKYTEMKQNGVRSFYSVALMKDDILAGYIGIENPREHLETTTMLLSISYFVLGEITKRKMKAEHDFIRTHDPLTGCLNWNSYNTYLTQFYSDTLSSLGIIHTDINQLNDINHRYGKEYGDSLIRFIAYVLKKHFGKQNVYRLAGDEFIVFREDIAYGKFMQKIDRCRSEIYKRYPYCASFGYTWADEDIQITRMLEHTSESLMAEKSELEGGLNHKRYKYEIMHQNLTRSLNQRRFEIYLQPKAEISTGKITGAEALIRYRDEEHGLITPDKFIPQLESAGLIRYIDFFVLEEVCKTLQHWKSKGIELFPVSLNFSRATLLEKGVVERIIQTSDRYGIERSLLEIEITESIGDLEHRILSEISKKIIQEGYRLSLDDFGAQYSNLSILSTLELSELKIDKSIINNLYSNENTRLIVENLVHICKKMGIDSVAEGVEEQEQLDVLSSIGCTYAQGYLYNKPIPVSDFEERYIAPLFVL